MTHPWASAMPKVTVADLSGATDNARALVRTMPVVVPASELYFWSEKWQSQEREFEADKAAGTLLSFETMDDAILDLMRAEDGRRHRRAVEGVARSTTGSLLTVGDIADAVWDEALTGHSTAGSAGKVLADTEANTDIIQAKVNEL